MEYLPNGAQMKEADRYTIQELFVPPLTLMERAAAACADWIRKNRQDITNICVVCGSGNNGGDGFAIARMFQEEGRRVTAVMAGNPEHLTEEAAYQKKLFEKTDGILCDDFPENEYSIIIDALFGVGLNREVTGKYSEIIRKMNACPGYKVAVDIPSGVSSDTGKVLGTAFQADATITFQARKSGLLFEPGKSCAGKLITADIGISGHTFKEDMKVAYMPELCDYRKLLPERKPDSNKGTCGKVLMIAGSKGMSGAAYLNALGAYRAGAGLVRIYTAEENRVILQEQLPEAVITTYELFDERELLKLLNRADTVCIGSGLGMSEKSRKILRTVIENAEVPCVIDADGLNLIAENKKYKDMLRKKKIILTPHMKEFSRLTGKSVEEIQSGRSDILRAFTKETGVTCILKDARTLILSGNNRICINPSGCAAMAKAGSGDVLAGIVTGFLAQGVKEEDAAVLGAYLHGRAGEYAASVRGRYSILAREIADNLGAVIGELEDETA